MVDFLEYAEAIQVELSDIIKDKKLSGQFRVRERTRILQRWLIHFYNMGRADLEAELKENAKDNLE